MSFQRLVNINETNATAYPLLRSNQPITLRRVTDETDTESNATRISEDSESDDGTGHQVDYNARILQRRQAQARVRNTLQYAHDGIDNGLQPVQNMANGIAGNGDHLYNDVARPFFHEAMFKIHVVVITIGRLLLRLSWFTLEGLWWSIWSTFDMVRETIWHVCYLVWALFNFTLEQLLRVFFAIPQVLRNTPWHRVEEVAAWMLWVLVIISLLHGFLRTAVYICDVPALKQEWTTVSQTCNHSRTTGVLELENMELDKLERANYAVIKGISDMASTGRPNASPGFRLMDETTALVQFVEAHSDSLASFSKGYDIVAVAKAVHSNVTALNNAAQRFGHNHRIRLDEMELKAQRILSDARKFRAQSPTERFFLESASYFLPSTFSVTSVARRTSRYIGVATGLLDDPLTVTILQQANNITMHMSVATQGIGIAKEAIARYEPFWKNHCLPNGDARVSGHIDCGVVDPSDLNERLAKALVDAQVASKTLLKLYSLHRTVKGGMAVVRSDLIRLLKIAAGDKTAAKDKTVAGDKVFVGKLDAASTRAVLHQFVVAVGEVDLMIGTGTFEAGMAFEGSVARGSQYKELPDGRKVPHLEKYTNRG